jgi:hypothetical protein
MQDWTAGQLRYLVHFDDGGSGMRLRTEPLDVGCELAEGRVTIASCAWSIPRTSGRSATRGQHESTEQRCPELVARRNG